MGVNPQDADDLAHERQIVLQAFEDMFKRCSETHSVASRQMVAIDCLCRVQDPIQKLMDCFDHSYLKEFPYERRQKGKKISDMWRKVLFETLICTPEFHKGIQDQITAANYIKCIIRSLECISEPTDDNVPATLHTLKDKAIGILLQDTTTDKNKLDKLGQMYGMLTQTILSEIAELEEIAKAYREKKNHSMKVRNVCIGITGLALALALGLGVFAAFKMSAAGGMPAASQLPHVVWEFIRASCNPSQHAALVADAMQKQHALQSTQAALASHQSAVASAQAALDAARQAWFSWLWGTASQEAALTSAQAGAASALAAVNNAQAAAQAAAGAVKASEAIYSTGVAVTAGAGALGLGAATAALAAQERTYSHAAVKWTNALDGVQAAEDRYKTLAKGLEKSQVVVQACKNLLETIGADNNMLALHSEFWPMLKDPTVAGLLDEYSKNLMELYKKNNELATLARDNFANWVGDPGTCHGLGSSDMLMGLGATPVADLICSNIENDLTQLDSASQH